MNKIRCKMKAYIQPFEKQLALRELENLAGARPIQMDGEPLTYLVNTMLTCDSLADRLTYWEYIRNGTAVNLIPLQVKREASYVNGNGNIRKALQQDLFFKDNGFVLPGRRVLRYGPHNLHEYRGKFFPQLVRSLLNSCKTGHNTIVMDNMCGSGTTLVEACLLGCNAYGLDMNPLSVLITRAKCGSLSVGDGALLEGFSYIRKKATNSRSESHLWLDKLPETSRLYLRDWFSAETITDLSCIAEVVNGIKDTRIRDVFTCVLSNIVRRVSYQKDDDLRVRREVEYVPKGNAFDAFFLECEKMVTNVGAFLNTSHNGKAIGKHNICEGDGRKILDAFPKIVGKVDLIITSPPYATALPYLDTDRLSLYFLNLMPRNMHRQKDKAMIGNREISNGDRERLWHTYLQQKKDLPLSITKVIDKIHNLNESAPVGFRRKNLSTLLSKYFLDMQQVFRGYRQILKHEGKAFLVVGNNHTIAGDRKVEIRTDRLLAELAGHEGLKVQDSIKMEMLVSRDIFKRNASSAETIIEMNNP